MPPVWRAWRKLNRAVRAVPTWSGPVGLGAMRTRSVVIGRYRWRRGSPGPRRGAWRRRGGGGRASISRVGTRWNSAGSASPGRTWTSAAGRSPSVARPRGPSSVSESSDSELARIVTWAPGVSARASRYDSRPGVLLGLLGDPVDRRLLAGLDLAERRPGRPPAGGLGVDRVAVRAGLGMAEHLVEAGLDPRRDRALQPGRLLVRLGPAEPDHRGQQPLEQCVATEDRVGGRAAGVGQDELPTVALVDEAVGGEAAEHLARRLGRDAHPAGHLGGLHVRSVARHHAQRQEVFLGRRGQVVGVGPPAHALMVRGASPSLRPAANAAPAT